MRRIVGPAMFLVALMVGTTAAAQQSQPSEAPVLTPQEQVSRDATREKLQALLESSGPRINVAFRRSTQNPYNFVGTLSQGLKNTDSLEIVVSVTAHETIGFRIYPHYKGGYINVDKAKNGAGLTRQIALFSDQNFLFWGADASGDIFSGYTFTLESGFPDAAIRVVLSSIANMDKFVGDIEPLIDGSTTP